MLYGCDPFQGGDALWDNYDRAVLFTTVEPCPMCLGATVMDGVEVGDDCVIAAGALLAPGTVIPPGSLALGSPAKVKRPVTDAERAWFKQSAQNYLGYAAEYLRDGTGK